MHDHSASVAESMSSGVILVGNPNVGKSVIFGNLSGKYVTVSNFPGTTVELSRGMMGVDGRKEQLIDTPGINNLLPFSEEERVTRDLLMQDGLKAVVQVVDAKNLKRGLLLTIQIAEMGLPLVVDLNMSDEATSRGISTDAQSLSKILGVDVVSTVAIRKKGMAELKDAMESPKVPRVSVDYGEVIEKAIEEISAYIPESSVNARAVALMVLAGDATITGWLEERLSVEEISSIEKIMRTAQARFSKPLSRVITRKRMKAAAEIADEEVTSRREGHSDFATTLGKLSMHPVWGALFVVGVLYFMYLFVGVFGAGYLADKLENDIFGGYVSVWLTWLFAHIPITLVRDLFVGEYGVLTMALPYAVAIILPVVVTFFIAFGILEDSGYLPRLAVMMNRVFKFMGLNGKAILPMVLGLGCDTMATLTTRILDTKKERVLVTLLLALGVPCSAQLGVILGMLGAISLSALMIWGGVVIVVLIVVGYLASKLLPGEGSDFILELPPLRVPKLGNITVKTLARVEWYLREAVPLFFFGTLLLFALNETGVLKVLERIASPVVQTLLGLPPKATESFIVGFLRRDYGVAGLYAMDLTEIQMVVSVVTLTLFIPCIANFLIMIKERGMAAALWMTAFILPTAFIVGGLLNFILKAVGY